MPTGNADSIEIKVRFELLRNENLLESKISLRSPGANRNKWLKFFMACLKINNKILFLVTQIKQHEYNLFSSLCCGKCAGRAKNIIGYITINKWSN